MKTLAIDIETAPNLAHVWGLWDQNVGLNQLVTSTEMLCFAAMWDGAKKPVFHSVHTDGKDAMIQSAHDLLSEADVVLHFNGRRFDVPHLNREFLEAGLLPPAPFKQVDLFTAAKRNFKFPSNKLAYISERLGLAGKEETGGFELWLQCMAGDDKAWRKMRKYNERDVTLLFELRDKLLPWIPNYPSAGAFTGLDVCPACASDKLVREGFDYTASGKYQRYHCADCGKWCKGNKRLDGTRIQEVKL